MLSAAALRAKARCSGVSVIDGHAQKPNAPRPDLFCKWSSLPFVRVNCRVMMLRRSRVVQAGGSL